MSELKQKDLMKYIVMILVFVLYTVLVPTMGLDWPIKIVIDAIVLGAVLYNFKTDFKQGWKETKKHPVKYVFMIIGFWIASLIISGIVNTLIAKIINIAPPNNNAQLELWKNAPFYAVFSMLLFSPIIEELAITIATKKIIKNKWFYLIASGLFCGLMYVAFSASVSYWFIFSYFIQQVIWAYAYWKTDNALVPVGIHLLQNMMALIIYMTMI